MGVVANAGFRESDGVQRVGPNCVGSRVVGAVNIVVKQNSADVIGVGACGGTGSRRSGRSLCRGSGS